MAELQETSASCEYTDTDILLRIGSDKDAPKSLRESLDPALYEYNCSLQLNLNKVLEKFAPDSLQNIDTEGVFGSITGDRVKFVKNLANEVLDANIPLEPGANNSSSYKEKFNGVAYKSTIESLLKLVKLSEELTQQESEPEVSVSTLTNGQENLSDLSPSNFEVFPNLNFSRFDLENLRRVKTHVELNGKNHAFQTGAAEAPGEIIALKAVFSKMYPGVNLGAGLSYDAKIKAAVRGFQGVMNFDNKNGSFGKPELEALLKLVQLP